MTRNKIIKDFFKNTVLTVVIAAVLFGIFRTLFNGNDFGDYLMIWICCGVPFGIRRMFVWLVPHGHDLGATMGILALNVIVGGLIGGCILFWRLLVAAWYLPLTVYRFVKIDRTASNVNIVEDLEA